MFGLTSLVKNCIKSPVCRPQQIIPFRLRKEFSTTLRKMQNPPVNPISSHESVVNGLKIHWERAGNGPHKLFLLPGALGSTRTDFLPQLTKLDGRLFTIYAWDPPGYGKSRPPDRTWPDKFFNRDAESAVALMKEIGLSKASLVGWSDGGITALVMAVLHPELVDKLVLFGSNAYITEQDVKFVESIRDLDKWSERMRKPFEEVYGEEYFRAQWSHWVDAYSAYLTKHNGDVVKERVCEIQSPTLIIHGQKDVLVAQEHPDYLHAQISNSQLVNWPEAKHNLHLRYADEFNALITEFLTKG